MKIEIFSENDRDNYNEFLAKSSYKDFLQSWEWGNVKSELGWEKQRIGFFENNNLKGICQILKKKLGFGYDIFYIPRGPVIDWEEKEIIKKSLELLKNFIKNSNKSLFLKIEPPVGKNEELELLLKSLGLVKYFKTIQPPATLLIDLTVSEEELLKKFRKTARNLIYRSKKEGLLVDVFDSDKISKNDLLGFYNIYKLTGKRFSFPLRPYKQFEVLLKEVNKKNNQRNSPVKLKMYIGKIKGFVLAQGIVVLLKDKAFYIWGGSTRHNYYSKFANYGFIWGMLSDLKKTGIKTFDFWGLGSLEDKSHPWYGFSLFKTAFDGKKFDYIGSFDLPLSKLYPLFRLADKIITPKYRATSG